MKGERNQGILLTHTVLQFNSKPAVTITVLSAYTINVRHWSRRIMDNEHKKNGAKIEKKRKEEKKYGILLYCCIKKTYCLPQIYISG